MNAEQKTVSNKWREDLPANCPPKGDAGPLTPQVLIRLAKANYDDDDFKSHNALGKPCTNNRLCEWSSCSMFLPSVSKTQLDDLRKYPNLRKMKVVLFVNIDGGSGEAKVSPSKHVDFWMYRSFDPMKAVAKSVPIDDYQ